MSKGLKVCMLVELRSPEESLLLSLPVIVIRGLEYTEVYISYQAIYH